jgi:2-haloacid dehalogenase
LRDGPLNALRLVHTLTFDVFGTILDLGGGHAPRLRAFVQSKGADIPAAELWARWRNRQRIEQYQDNQFYTGHYGYLDSSRRALIYTLRASKVPFGDADVARIMEGWRELTPFPDALPGLRRLATRFKLVALSNGERELLTHLVKNRIGHEFAAAISVEDVGVFKPHPQVYRYAARVLGAEPCELMMVSSHSFDVVGARASGYRAAYVNRYDLPYDETPYRFDVETDDLLSLADKLGCT